MITLRWSAMSSCNVARMMNGTWRGWMASYRLKRALLMRE
jgi:hypothetical protein